MNKRRLNNAQDFSLMGCYFCKKALKKIIHLFNAHMPTHTQIARSTVLHMQICFAWKSIWSCSKESRTALLLSPLAGSHGAPFAVSSRVENIFTSLTCVDILRSQWRCLASDGSNHHGPICRSHGPRLRAEQGGPRLFDRRITRNTRTQEERSLCSSD